MATKTTTPKPQSGSEIIKALEVAWNAIVKKNPEVPNVVIITGSGLSGGNSKWAHFWRERWTGKDDKTARPEMFVAGERLACGAELTLQSMLHEAAHAVAYVRGEQDTSRGNRYHNGTFRKIAGELGLTYNQDKPASDIGFSAVELTEDAKIVYKKVIDDLDKAIRTYLDDPLISILTGITTTGGAGTTGLTTPYQGGNRIKRGTFGGPKAPSRNNVKYVCECDKPRVMRMAPSTFELASVTCGDCESEFHEDI